MEKSKTVFLCFAFPYFPSWKVSGKETKHSFIGIFLPYSGITYLSKGIKLPYKVIIRWYNYTEF